MNTLLEQQLKAAWQRVDDRVASLQRRHREKGDIPLYEAALNPPATDQELQQLERAWGVAIPFELAYSLKRWNGRLIAHDHMIDLSSVADLLYLAETCGRYLADDSVEYEHVIGPINPIFESKKRYNFGGHEFSGSSLYLDYVTPPAGGTLGQVIRDGEEPIARFVAASFVDFLNLIADAPVHDDVPDFDPLEWKT